MLTHYGLDYFKWDGDMRKKIELIVEWSATVVLMLGVLLTSLNVFPLNVFISGLGNFGWLVVAIMWKRWSLIIAQSVILTIYVYGLISKGVIGF